MADKVVFSTNVPESVALKYANGKRVESRYNEVYYSLTDGRALYPTPALDAKITALAPAAGEVFTICKAEIREGNRKRIEWQVTPSETQEAPQEPTAAAVPAPAAATSRPESVAAPVAVSEAGTMTQIMGGALIAAIDSLAAAAKHAAEKHGWKLEFNEEDIRASANSVFMAPNGSSSIGGTRRLSRARYDTVAEPTSTSEPRWSARIWILLTQPKRSIVPGGTSSKATRSCATRTTRPSCGPPGAHWLALRCRGRASDPARGGRGESRRHDSRRTRAGTHRYPRREWHDTRHQDRITAPERRRRGASLPDRHLRTDCAADMAYVDTLVKTKQPQLIQIAHRVDDREIRQTQVMYPLVQDAMRGGLYDPNRASNLCSRKHCAFWKACTAEFGGTISAA